MESAALAPKFRFANLVEDQAVVGAGRNQDEGGNVSKPNPVDVHVGGRIRLRRTLLGFSQDKLAQGLGLTFQQIQKYERGANRVGASRLYQLSRVLDVPVSYFFEDMPAAAAGNRPAAPGLAEAREPFEADPLAKRETLELVRAYYQIRNPQTRKRLFELVKTLGKGDD